MSKRALLNLTLLCVVIALALVVFYKPGKDKPANTKLTDFENSDIQLIQLDRTGNPTIKFKRVDKTWHMTEPYTLKANSITVEALLDLLAYNHHGQYDMAELDPKTYGLDLPRASITFNEKYKFDFGTTETLNKYRYIRYNNKLNLTDDYYYHRILGAATSFLDHALLPENSQIENLIIPGLKLTQQDGTWQANPSPSKFSNDRANELAENWQHAHGNEITQYDPAKEKASAKVIIQLKGNDAAITYDILTIDNEFYLGRADLKIKYKLAKEKRRDLLQLPAALNTSDIVTPEAESPKATSK